MLAIFWATAWIVLTVLLVLTCCYYPKGQHPDDGAAVILSMFTIFWFLSSFYIADRIWPSIPLNTHANSPAAAYNFITVPYGTSNDTIADGT